MNKELLNFTNKEIVSYEKKYQDAFDNYQELGTPGRYKTMKKYEDMIDVFSYANIGIKQNNNTYEVFQRQLEGLKAGVEEIKSKHIENEALEALKDVIELINQMSHVK